METCISGQFISKAFSYYDSIYIPRKPQNLGPAGAKRVRFSLMGTLYQKKSSVACLKIKEDFLKLILGCIMYVCVY